MQRVVRHSSNKAAMARTVQGLGCCERHDDAGARRKRKARRVHRRRAVRHAHHGRYIIVVRRKQVHGGNRRPGGQGNTAPTWTREPPFPERVMTSEGACLVLPSCRPSLTLPQALR